jgi:hypothetical protein
MRARLGFPRAAVFALAALAVGACTNDVTYSYFEVGVSIDRASVDDDTRKQITYCAFLVKGPSPAQTNLPCARGEVGYDLGKVGWSTKLTTGQVYFVVEMLDFNHVVLARGQSAIATVAPNQVTAASVVAYAVTPTPADGGASDAGAKDAAASDAGHADGGPADGAADATTD